MLSLAIVEIMHRCLSHFDILEYLDNERNAKDFNSTKHTHNINFFVLI